MLLQVAEGLLFDDWFDAIEDGVRCRVRGFIETMLEEELSGALSRPRYGRCKLGEDDAAPSVVDVRHGHREQALTGTFGASPCRGLDSLARTARRGNGAARRFAPTSAAPRRPTR